MAKKQRMRVLRTDGKPINLVRRRGHLLVCAKGCCCGRTERGHAEVPIDFYKHEYKRRKIRNQVQLSVNGCLGPCPLSNVVLLFFDGRPIWFQSVNAKPQIVAIFDYVERLLAADVFLPPPPELAEYVFDFYTWTNAPGALRTSACASPSISTEPANGFHFLSHADTDLLTLHHAGDRLPDGFPPIRTMSLGKVGSSEHMEALLGELGKSRVIVARLLGGARSVPGFARLVKMVRERNQHLVVISGSGNPDPELAAASTVAPAVLHEATAYLHSGGVDNVAHMFRFLADHLLMTGFGYTPAARQPLHSIYHPDLPRIATLSQWQTRRDPARPAIGLLFYRSHWISGNLAFVDVFVRALEQAGADVLPVFTSSLKDTADSSERVPAAFQFFRDENGLVLIDVLITTMSFALGDGLTEIAAAALAGGSRLNGEVFSSLDVPVVQAICAGTAAWQWEASPRGFNPLDTVMNVALPEFDGRIITVPISFKEALTGAPAQANGHVDVIQYVPMPERMARVAALAMRLASLRRKHNQDKRIAFILTNSPGKAARIGNAVGLDAPASLMRVLEAMQAAGYHMVDVPADGDALIHALIDRCSYDETLLTAEQLAGAAGRVPVEQYWCWFGDLQPAQQKQMAEQWGPPPGEAYVHDGHIALAGLELGNVFIALQPPRGYGMDPNAIYHRPDLPPPHNYYALYRWLREVWQADAIVHVGKHGTLEWLPGKSVGMSAGCYPDTFLADMPLFYPFIVNDPGEGAQAKRRAHAVIVDHLTPPMTTAGAYGELAELMQLVDEYYQVELLDPSKMSLLQQQIWDLIKSAHLEDDLKLVMQQKHGDHVHEWEDAQAADGTPVTLAQMQGRDVAHLVQELDGYLCELAGAQIRDGLHILGQVPQGDQMVGLLHALTRLPNLDVPSLPAAVAGLFDVDPERLFSREPPARANVVLSTLARGSRLNTLAGRTLATATDVRETVDELCQHLLALMQRRDFRDGAVESVLVDTFAETDALSPAALAGVREVLLFICRRLVPSLQRTSDEITNLLRGLDGCFVPAGPSGAPTRGMAHVLPSGRNFYAVDPRALPSAAAWQVGQELAREVLQCYCKETGSFPETVGISIWGTSAMRTQGDDVAEIMALLGVRPIWQKENRRIIGIEAIPLEELGRPRIDVLIRISGFFRDAFPHLIAILDEAVQTVVALDEPASQNFVRKHYLADLGRSLGEAPCDGDRSELEQQARYRIFGSKPGSYGAGLLPLIDERNWHDDADLAETYVNWGGYAYTADEQGVDARAVFRQRLEGVQVALHNQDNREHDIFDSDDYFQFHGGMIAAIRALTGRNPHHYFGDSHDPAHPAVRDLKEETLRVFRSRVVNPKWLESITRHGYKGGLELAATVDYLFGYDATAGVVEDWMYEQVARSYALNPGLSEFFARSNPWALRAISERLLEAAERGLWGEPKPETLAALNDAFENSETVLEMRSEAV
jgi:cobaltochelatase CobN